MINPNITTQIVQQLQSQVEYVKAQLTPKINLKDVYEKTSLPVELPPADVEGAVNGIALPILSAGDGVIVTATIGDVDYDLYFGYPFVESETFKDVTSHVLACGYYDVKTNATTGSVTTTTQGLKKVFIIGDKSESTGLLGFKLIDKVDAEAAIDGVEIKSVVYYRRVNDDVTSFDYVAYRIYEQFERSVQLNIANAVEKGG